MNLITSILPRRLKSWLWRKLSDNMHLEYRLPSGMRVKIASYSDWCIYNDIFVTGEYDKAINAALDKANFEHAFQIVDLGANAGFFTMRVLDLIFRRQIKFDRIHCLLVEASPSLRVSLHRHFDGIDREEVTVKIVIGLVGLKTGEARLELKASECMNHVVEKSVVSSCLVPYYNLEDAFDETSKIGLLKCDIEGSERDFLENYTQLLCKTHVAVFEFHDPMCPASIGVPKVMKTGFIANHVLLDQGHATTIYFER